MNSKQPRKQRKNLYNAPLHHRRKWLVSHLAEDLMVKYSKRSIPVVRGDTVKVVRGNFKNQVDKVREVYLRKQLIEIESVVTTKVDGSKVPRPVHPSNVIITRLNLTDPMRREKLERGLSEEAKKEIEMEARKQIEEEKIEEARKAAEEEAKEKEIEETPDKEEAKDELKDKEEEEETIDEGPVEESKEESESEPVVEEIEEKSEKDDEFTKESEETAGQQTGEMDEETEERRSKNLNNKGIEE